MLGERLAQCNALFDVGDKECSAPRRQESLGDVREAKAVTVRFDHRPALSLGRMQFQRPVIGDNGVKIDRQHAGQGIDLACGQS